MGKFINADDYMGSTGGMLSHNVFAYCANKPVMRVDPNGNRPVEDDFEVITVSYLEKTFISEEEAAAAFFAEQIPKTEFDGIERCAYIIPNDEGFEIYSGRVHKGGKGIDGREYIGIGAILNLPVGLGASMVYTHPSSKSDPGFSNEDKSWMIDFFGMKNVYMGTAGDAKRGVYKLTPSGPVNDASGNLKIVAYY